MFSYTHIPINLYINEFGSGRECSTNKIKNSNESFTTQKTKCNKDRVIDAILDRESKSHITDFPHNWE